MTPDPQNKTPWWQPSLIIFGQVSMWVALPLVLAVIIGRALDKHFGTKPWIFLGLIAMAFLASCFMIVKVIKAYIKKLEKEDKEKKDREKVS